MAKPKIHGTTKIELYNPNTKVRAITRSENVFQGSKIATYMRSLGENVVTQYSRSETPYLWQYVVGGIYLFRDSIPEGSSYMPAGNRMIGNGAERISNTSNVAEMGSFNELESSASDSAITQVYDFSTSQGNGQISCVCLTSKVGGYIGYGNQSGNVLSTKWNQIRGSATVSSSSRPATYGMQYGNYEYYCYHIDSNSILKIRKVRRGMSVASVFDSFYTDLFFDLNQIGNHYNAADDVITFYPVGNGKFRGIPRCSNSNSIGAGGTIYYYEFDTTNDTLTEKSLLNPTGKTILLGNSYQNWTFFGFGGDTLFCVADSDYKREVIKVSTDTHLAELNFTDRISGFFGTEFTPGIIKFRSNNIEYLYDTVANTCFPCNMSTDYDYYAFLDNDTLQSIQTFVSSSSFSEYAPYNSPFYLATINNLQTAVTKTAAQTMKVTYTLTEV